MSSMNRKTATRLLLINWSRFQYENIRIAGSTLFTGVNGSGKSTILDAMTYLLTGNTQFNTAAKDKDRNVKSYVRGDTKNNGDSRFLRQGEVISYIALEFWSPVDNASMVIGVVIESPNENDAKSSWFILRNTKMDDVRFCEEKGGVREIYPQNKLLVKGNKLPRTEYLGRDKAKEQILRALGMRCDSQMYKKKLLKMMAFNPENNIDQFIAECVLEADPIESLAQLREQKELFEKVRYMYENLLDCKNALEQLEKATSEYERRQRNYQIRDIMLDLQRVKIAEDEIKKIEIRLKKLEQQLIEAQYKRDDLGNELKYARERYQIAVNNPDFQDLQKSIDNLNAQVEELQKNISIQEKQMDKLREAEKLLKGELEWLLHVDEKIEQNATVLRELSTEKYSEIEKGEAFFALAQVYEDTREDLQRSVFKGEEKSRELRENLSEQEQIIKRLQANILHLPKEIVLARERITKELSNQGIVTQVRTFAELVAKVENESWRAAIETFLGRKRYYFIVEGKYCHKVMEIIQNCKLHAANVVVTDKLPDSEVNENSAAAQLMIPNADARRYANYLLNGIHLCASLEELHEYPLGGLTKDGMLAKSYAVSCLNVRRTEMCLGTDAIKLQKKRAEEECTRLKDELAECESEIKESRIRLKSMDKLDVKASNYRFDAPKLLMKYKMSLQKTLDDIEGFKNNPGFARVLEEQQRASEQVMHVEGQYNSILTEIGGIQNSITNSNHEREKAKEYVVEADRIYEEKKKHNSELILAVEDEYEKQTAAKGSLYIVKESYVRNLSTEVDKAKVNMETKQLDYCKLAELDNSRRGVSYIPFYREQYNDLSNVKLEEAKNKMHEQEKNLQSAFMHDFIGEINEAIRAAKDEIGAINRELKQIPFGHDTYRFIMKEKSDRAIFFRICNKLSEYMNSPELYMLNNRDDEEMEHDIKQFMDTILDEEDETEYTDYRKYFVYDMEIARNVGDKQVTADLSKKQGSASNGEKQTPYFIILAASLLQCYPKNTCCARLAFIDEAFSALSRERIEQMVKYFEANDFQVIYAAPPEKIASIGQFITTTVSLYQKGNYSYAIEGLYAD